MASFLDHMLERSVQEHREPTNLHVGIVCTGNACIHCNSHTNIHLYNVVLDFTLRNWAIRQLSHRYSPSPIYYVLLYPLGCSNLSQEKQDLLLLS